MNRTVACLYISCLSCAIASGQQPLAVSNANDDWQIKWSVSDEFSGDEPNWKKWIKAGNLPETSSWYWRNEKNVEVSDGRVKIALRHSPTEGRFFSSGILKSYRTFTYGYFEARLQGVDWETSGACPSFWLFSRFNDKVDDGNVIYDEIDIVELQQLDWHEGHQDDARDMDLNLHCVVKQQGTRQWRRPKKFPKEQLNKWRAPWHPGKGLHVYGCEVNREEIIWYVDGTEVARKKNTYWHGPKHVALSLGLRRPFVTFRNNRNMPVDPQSNPEVKSRLSEFPVAMVVDYVRVWEKTEQP